MAVNETHDPVLRSWVDSANVADSDFPIQNLPLGIIYGADGEPARGAVAIGDQALDLALALKSGCLGAYGQEATRALELASESTLNALMASGPSSANALRLALSRALRVGSKQREPLQACLRPQAPQSMALPARIGDYTDFYTGIHHATAVGRLFRPDAPLLPNYKWVPIG
jgi:fumarylacetoacetase